MISKQYFGELDGKKVFLYTLTNSKGNEVRITNYGGIITSWVSPDINGNRSSIVIGFDSLDPYLEDPPYFGALVGRYANRIAKGRFTLDNIEYNLPVNNGINHLHGGIKGFDKVVWNAEIIDGEKQELSLNYISPDGEQGYPGELKVNVRYIFTDEDELKITYHAVTDKPTIVNLTQHSYFNLTGDASNTIYDHLLFIDANRYTPVDGNQIPIGKLETVRQTAFDFTSVHPIGARIAEVPGGYDHNWVLNSPGDISKPAAILTERSSGRKLEVYTEQPGIQFYSGNFLDGKFQTKTGSPINIHSALCLETQHFPDSPNQPSFPSTILRPGEEYSSFTCYKLSVGE